MNSHLMPRRTAQDSQDRARAERHRTALVRFLLKRGRASDRTVWNLAQVAHAAMGEGADYWNKSDEMHGRSGIERAWRQIRARVQRQARRQIPEYLFPLFHRCTGLSAEQL